MFNLDIAVKNIGRKISELRRKRGWTQSQLAEKLDVSLKLVQVWESGKNDVRIRSLFKIAIALNYNPTELLKKPLQSKPSRGRPRNKPTQKANKSESK